MIATVPTERIVNVLEGAGYKSLPIPLVIAGVPFEFSAALVGTGWSADLIVVADSTEEKDARILQKIEGLARAMDAVSSLRPLTLVLVGARPNTQMLDAMAGVCRVLAADGAAGKIEIEHRLAVLLPLVLPELKNLVVDLTSLVGQPHDEDPIISRLLVASAGGEEDVKQLLFNLVSEPFAGGDDELEEISDNAS